MPIQMVDANGDHYEADNETQAEMESLRGSRRADVPRPAVSPEPGPVARDVVAPSERVVSPN